MSPLPPLAGRCQDVHRQESHGSGESGAMSMPRHDDARITRPSLQHERRGSACCWRVWRRAAWWTTRWSCTPATTGCRGPPPRPTC